MVWFHKCVDVFARAPSEDRLVTGSFAWILLYVIPRYVSTQALRYGRCFTTSPVSQLLYPVAGRPTYLPMAARQPAHTPAHLHTYGSGRVEFYLAVSRSQPIIEFNRPVLGFIGNPEITHVNEHVQHLSCACITYKMAACTFPRHLIRHAWFKSWNFDWIKNRWK